METGARGLEERYIWEARGIRLTTSGEGLDVPEVL